MGALRGKSAAGPGPELTTLAAGVGGGGWAWAPRGQRAATGGAVGNHAEHGDGQAQAGQCNCDIRLGPTHCEIEPIAAVERGTGIGRKPQQQFAEADDMARFRRPLHRASQPPSTARIWPCT